MVVCVTVYHLCYADLSPVLVHCVRVALSVSVNFNVFVIAKTSLLFLPLCMRVFLLVPFHNKRLRAQTEAALCLSSSKNP